MHRILSYAAFGWLSLSAGLHFGIDVVSQYLRHKRAPGPETHLYYGLNTAFALGQLVFGLMGLLFAQQIFSRWPGIALSLFAAGAWLTFGFLFLEYREPRFIAAVFGGLVLAAALTAHGGVPA